MVALVTSYHICSPSQNLDRVGCALSSRLVLCDTVDVLPFLDDDFASAERYLDGLLDYERLAGPPRERPPYKLERMACLLDLTGLPAPGLRFLWITGTKGKGSTAAVLVSLLTSHGLSAGLFSSPHLLSVRERVSVNGRAISPRDFVAALRAISPGVATMGANGEEARPSYFETILAMALHHFARTAAVAVMEVGMGGRLDATSLLPAEVRAITPISLDHTQVLGVTPELIAQDKVSAARPSDIIASAHQTEGVEEVIRRLAGERGCTLFTAGKDFAVNAPVLSPQLTVFDYNGMRSRRERLEVPLAGRHQAENAGLALAMLEAAEMRGIVRVSEEGVRSGLRATRWAGRLHLVEGSPRIVLDGAQNDGSAIRLREALDELFPALPRVLLIGMGNDKDAEAVLTILCPGATAVVVTRSTHPRATPPSHLAEVCRSVWHGQVLAADEPAQALRVASEAANGNGLVCVCGSQYLVADVMRLLDLTAMEDAPDA